MQKPVIDQMKVRDQMKTKRNLLLEEYSKNPTNSHLAIEIKLLDDQLAELTEQLVQERKSRRD
ncbi:MAG TPA: hypothetical protein VJX70_11760 [Candidatus Acidoferrum sp.]|nr:hypothetical protein [Candidatus Acidoferrum sp.]